MNTLLLPEGAVLTEAAGDMRGYGLNFTTLPRETLYMLQDGVTAELHTRDKCALQVLSE